jgi:hypothetical protein
VISGAPNRSVLRVLGLAHEYVTFELTCLGARASGDPEVTIEFEFAFNELPICLD